MNGHDPAREQRDETTRAWHNMAVAHGDDRMLLRTTAGELHSYRSEEIGFITGGTGVNISTGRGMLIAAVPCFAAALALAWFTIFSAPGATGGERTGLVCVALAFAGLGWLFLTYARREGRAKRLRKARGLPEPFLESRVR